MRFRIGERHDGGIVHEQTRTHVGRVDRNTVQGEVVYVFEDDDDTVVVTTKSILDGFAAFAAHEALRPRQWEKASASEYQKETRHYDTLSVRQTKHGKWVILRNDCELVDRNGRIVVDTREQAQQLADLHIADNRDGDGLSWLEQNVPECQSPAYNYAEPDLDPLLVERWLGELMADTALAMVRAAAEQNMRGGNLRPETNQRVVDLIARLHSAWAFSLHGSYDSERHRRQPYFAAEDGRRLIFGEAARHYGMIALRKRLPNASEARLREVLSWPLELLASTLHAIRRDDGDPPYAQATDAEMQELEAILTAA